MSILAPPDGPRTALSIVPTQRTRAMAQAMMVHTDQATGFDAVIRHLRYVKPDQYAALLGVILEAGRGEHRLAAIYTEDERRDAHRRYGGGERGDWVEQGEREYQRIAKRQQRQRGAA